MSASRRHPLVVHMPILRLPPPALNISIPPELTYDQILQLPEALILESSNLSIHPIFLEKQPETVLEKLAQWLLVNELPPKITFLRNNLLPQPGIDIGGLRNQLMSELFRHLLDSSDSRIIQMNGGIPAFSNSSEKRDSEEGQLKNLGIVLGRCFKHNELITGRILPDCFFQLIQNLIRQHVLNNASSVEQMTYVSECLIAENMKYLMNIYKTRQITAENRMQLRELRLFDLSKADSDVVGQIGHYLAELYCSRVQAAAAVIEGMRSVMNTNELDYFTSLAPSDVSSQIQGLAFSRPDIAHRIRCDDNNPVVQQKTNWLCDYILDARTPQEWIEKLLFTITGQRVVTAGTAINVCSSFDDMCRAHTCFSKLDVPTNHTNVGTSQKLSDLSDRQKFFNNLHLLLDSGLDFLIA